MRFLFSFVHSRRPMTPFQFLAILDAERCTPVYRFSHVLIRDQYGQEYYLCQRDQLAMLSPWHCRELLLEALSYRSHMQRSARKKDPSTG